MSDTVATPSTASTAAHDDPALFRLPTELLLDILSELSYAELHKVQQVCKKIQGLVAHKSLDYLLFRQKRKLKKGEKVDLHPLLVLIEGVHITETVTRINRCGPISHAPDHVYQDFEDFEEFMDEFNAYDCKAADEYATRPPCTKIYLYVAHGDYPAVAKNRNGVKNRDVFKALGKYWEQAPPQSVVRELVQDFGVSHARATSSWRETLGDHDGWNGFRTPKCPRDGVVKVAANTYDS